MDKETKRVVMAAKRRGWMLDQSSKHPTLTHPSGRKVVFSGTPSCRHVHKNVQKDIDRIERDFATPAAMLQSHRVASRGLHGV